MFDMMPFRRNNPVARRNMDDFERMVDSFFNDVDYPFTNFSKTFKTDIKETDNEYIMEADMPGINKENIEISYDNNMLSIKAKNENKIDNNNDNYIRQERSYGELSRSFWVDNVDESKIKASFKNGVLKVILPKMSKTNISSRKINIE